MAPVIPKAGAKSTIPCGPNLASIAGHSRNSTGAPNASPTAPPSRQPLIRSSLFMSFPLSLCRDQFLQNHQLSLQLLDVLFLSSQRRTQFPVFHFPNPRPAHVLL